MSQTIDERVVEMKFDASQFNSNISSSIDSINKLNSSIDNMSKGESLLNLGRAASKVDFSKVEWAATHAGFHIEDVFEKATRFLENNIARRIVDFGTNISKSLTIEPVFTGFNEYEQKMGSVQTIMNGANVTMEETMATLEELNKYADRTIYSFGDMTNNIGKFVNAGVKLDDAVMAIKGISNEAAVSGATAAEASRAMYNIAQALSTGSMKLIDWKSIENANMATMEFKKTLIETGIEMNAIKAGATSSLSAEELKADPSKFRASIEGVKGQTWVTDKVMIEALKKYADETTAFGQKAYAAAQDVKTFTMLMDTLKEAAQSGWSESMENIVGNFEQAKAMWTAVNEEVGGLLDASSKARNDLLKAWSEGGGRDALLNSIGNVWFTIKDTIIGVKESFREIFPATTSDQLIGITKGLETLTARLREFMASAQTMGTIKNIFSGFFKAMNSIKSAFAQIWQAGKSVFGNIVTAFKNVFSLTGEAEGFAGILVKIGSGIETAGRKINTFFSNSTNAQNLTRIFQGIFSAIDLVRKGLVGLWNVATTLISPLLSSAGGAGSVILDILANIADFITAINSGGNIGDILGNMASGLKNFATSAIESVKGLNIFEKAFDTISGIVAKIKSVVSGFSLNSIFGVGKGEEDTAITSSSPIIAGLTILKNAIVNTFTSIKNSIQESGILKPLATIANGILKAAATIQSGLVKLISYINPAAVLKPIGAILTGLVGLLTGILNVASSLLNAIGSILDGLANMFQTAPFLAISLLFNNIINVLKLFTTKSGLRNIADSLKSFVTMFTTVGTDFTNAIASIAKGFESALKSFEKGQTAKAAKNFAIAVAIIAGALVVLSTVQPERLAVSIVALVAVAAMLRIALNSLSKIKIGFFSKIGVLTASLIKFSIGIAILATALKTIGSLDIDNMAAALISTIALMFSFVKVAEQLSKLKPGNISKIGFTMIEFSVGIRILASAVAAMGQLSLGDIVTGLVGVLLSIQGLIFAAQELGKIKSDTIFKAATSLLVFSVAVRLIASAITSMGEMGLEGVAAGLIGLTVILGELVIAARILGESNTAMQAAVVLLALSVSIGILGRTLSTFGNMSTEQLTQGMYAIIVAVGAMLAITRLLPEEFNKSAIALIACAIALNVMTNAVKSLGEMDFLNMMQGLLGLAAAMGIMAGMLKLIEGSLSGAAAMIIVSAGLVIFGAALSIFAGIPLTSMVKGLIGIAGALTILGVALYAMSGSIVGALALTVAAAGLMAIAAAMMMLSTLSMSDVVVGLIALVGAITVLAVAGALCAPILPFMAGLAGVLLLMAASVAVVGLGLMLIGEALVVLSSNGMAGVLFLTAFGYALALIIPLSLSAAVTLTALSAAFFTLTAALLLFSVALITVSTGLVLLSAGLIAISAGLTAVSLAAIVCAAAFAAIAGNLGATVDILNGFSGDFLNAGKELLTSFINGIKSMIGKAVDAIKSVGKTILNGFKSVFGIGDDGVCEEAYNDGKSVGESYKKGIEESKPEAEAAAEDFGGGLMDKLKSSFGADKLDPTTLLGGDMSDLSKAMGGDLDMSSVFGTDKATDGIKGLNGELENTKDLTGDSALNIDSMTDGSTNMESIMEDLGVDTKIVSNNTGDASDNLGDIENMDFSNVEALSDANLDGLTDPQNVKEIDKTKESIDALSESVDETNEKKIKPEVDTSELDQLVEDVLHGKYGNGMERMIALAERYGEVQNKVNEKLGSSKRYEVGVDYSKGQTSTSNNTYDLSVNDKRFEAEAAYKKGIREGASDEDLEKLRENLHEAYREWAEYWKKKSGHLSVEGYHGVRNDWSRESELDMQANDANDSKVREEQAKRLAAFEESLKAYGSLKAENDAMIASISEMNDNITTIRVNGTETADEIKKKIKEVEDEGNKARIVFDKIPDSLKSGYGKSLVNNLTQEGNIDRIPASELERIKNIEDEQKKWSEIWNNNNRNLINSNNDVAKSYDKVAESIEKTALKYDNVKSSQSGEEGSIFNEQTLQKARERNSASFTGEMGHKYTQEAGFSELREFFKKNWEQSVKDFSLYRKDFSDEKKALDAEMWDLITSKDAWNKAFSENVEIDPEKLKMSAKGAGYVLINALKEQSVDVPVEADTKQVQQIPTQIAQVAKNTDPIDVPVEADKQKVAYLPTEVENAIKSKNPKIDVPVKADSKEVVQATKDVDSLKKSTDGVKDKKVTLEADASGALKIVENFEAAIKKMSIAVDAETVKVKQSFQNFYTQLQQTIQTYTPTIVSNFKQTFEYAIHQTESYLKSEEVIGKFKSAGSNAGKGFADGLKSQLSAVKSAAKELANAASSSAKKTLDEHSPSRVFFGIGAFGGEGFIDGFLSTLTGVAKAAEELGTTSVDTVMKQLANINLDDIDTTPTIRPVLDMSNLQANAGTINSMFNRDQVGKISAEVSTTQKDQQVQDQMLAQRLDLMNEKFAELSEILKNQEPTPVEVDVSLEGDASKFFEAMRNQSKVYTRRTGKNAFA